MNKKYIIILIIIIIFALAGGGWYWYSKNQPVNPPVTKNEGDATATSTEEIDMSDWLTYRNEQYGFEVRYPREWDIQNGNPAFESVVTLISPETLKNIAAAVARKKATEIPGGDIVISIINAENMSVNQYLENNIGPGNIIYYNQTKLNNSLAYEALMGGFGSYYALYLENDNIIYRMLFELKDKKEELSETEMNIINSFQFIN